MWTTKRCSKSLNNFFTVRDVAERFGYEPIRFFLISSHYRSPINYNAEIIEQGRAALDRLYNCRDGLEFALENGAEAQADPAFAQRLEQRREQFIRAMDDDLNTADAIAALFELAKDINVRVAAGIAREEGEAALTLFGELTGVLGLLYAREKENGDAEVEALIAAGRRPRAQGLGGSRPHPGSDQGIGHRAGRHAPGREMAPGLKRERRGTGWQCTEES